MQAEIRFWRHEKKDCSDSPTPPASLAGTDPKSEIYKGLSVQFISL
jgi:hypothetical protein